MFSILKIIIIMKYWRHLLTKENEKNVGKHNNGTNNACFKAEE